MSAPAAPSRPIRRWRRFAVVILVFLVFGPPIGTLLLVGGVELIHASTSGKPPRIATWLFSDPYFVFGMGYVIGGLPAAFAGLVVGIGEAFRDGATWPWAVAAALLSGFGMVSYLFLTVGLKADDMRLVSPQSAAIVLTCVLPALVCWAIVRAIYRRSADVTVP